MAHYFSNEKLPSNIKKINLDIYSHTFVFSADNGVFSKEHIDYGSKFLLEQIDMSSVGEKVLDVGCGYGTFGIVIAKATGKRVDMVDVNIRALHLAEMNAKDNNVGHLVKIYESSCYSNVVDKYDTIVTNPPIRAGKKIVYEILFGAKERLNENGKLYLVIRKEQGAKSLISDLEKEYNVEVLDKSKGFFAIVCTF